MHLKNVYKNANNTSIFPKNNPNIKNLFTSQIAKSQFKNNYIQQQNKKHHLKNLSVSESNAKTGFEIESTTNDIEKFKGKKAIVIGAGPAGATAAAYLSKYGFNVKIYDRLNDPRIASSSTRVLLVAIRNNAVEVLNKINADLPFENGFKNGLHKYYGINFISYDSIKTSLLDLDAIPGIIGERDKIQLSVLNAIANSENVELEFNCECETVDFENQILKFRNKENEEVIEKYDFLIGADGTNSVIRKQIEKENKDFNIEYITSRIVYIGYKSSKPLNDKDSEYLDKFLKPGELNFFQFKTDVFEGKKTPPGLALAKAENGNYLALMSTTNDISPNIKGKESRWIEAVAPDTLPKQIIQELIEKLNTIEFSELRPLFRIPNFIGPKTILMGDAAHTFTPNGNGMNLAIINSYYLDLALKQENDIDNLNIKYNELVFGEADSTVFLEMINSFTSLNLDLKYKIWLKFGRIHRFVHNNGNKLFPNLISKSIFSEYGLSTTTAEAAIKKLKMEAYSFLTLMSVLFIFIIKEFFIIEFN